MHLAAGWLTSCIFRLSSQREVVYEELERLTEQYQQVTSAFEAQSIDLAESQVGG